MPSPSGVSAGIIPKNPPGGSTVMTERTGCLTLPAEKSMSAFSIAGIKSSIRKCRRTCSSSRCNGSLRFIRCSMFDVGHSRFALLLTADYADNTDLTWNQRLIWKPRNHERSKKGKESGKEERRKALLK